MPVSVKTGQSFLENFNAMPQNDNWRSGSSAESRIHKFYMKYGGLPTAATIVHIDFLLAVFTLLA